MKNILIVEPDFKPDQSYAYYYNMIKAISSVANVHILPGRGYKIHIDELKRQIPNLDVICYGFGWMNIWTNGVHYVETIIEGIEETDLTKVVFLNKEYGGSLGSKLGWIRDIKPDMAFTYHHDYEMFERATGVPFVFLPFAGDPEMFKDYGITPEYDIGFTGGMGHPDTNGWETQCEIGKYAPFKAEGQGWSHNLREQVRDAHEDWEEIDFFFSNHKHDTVEQYAKRLGTAKMWLSTTGPVDIVGTRYYEVMLTNTTLLMCNRSDKMWCFDDSANRKDRKINVYDGLFLEDEHYVAFNSPEELREKINFYKNNEQERIRIVNNAHEYALKNHTWRHRAQKFIDSINSLED